MASPNECAWWKITLIFLAGGCFLMLGGLSIPFLQKFIHDKVSQQVPIRQPGPSDNGSSTDDIAFDLWKDIPVPMYVSFRFFHVENPLEIITYGEKPFLTEKGPYVYSERRHKKDIVFAENGTIVSFREVQVFHFVPEMSKGDESDELRLLNVPFVTILNQAKGQSWFKRQALKLAITTTGESLFETKSVKEWLWGYNDKLLELLKLSQPDMVPFTFFGWFMNKNNTAPGNMTIKTGLGDVSREAEVVTWNDQSALDVWTDSYCNAINGTDGTMFHPFIEKNETLYIFSSDICRSIYIQFTRETSVKGIHALRFVAPEMVFANDSVNPDNGCYCVPDLDHCLGAGVLNISSCQFGAPVVSSSPHMYQADPRYLERLHGLHPSKALHETFLDIEPVTGIVLNAAKRLQVNAFVDNIPDWSTYFQKFPDKLIFPVIWFEEAAVLDDSTAATMRGQVTDQLNLVFAIQVTLFVFGGFLLSVVILLLAQKIHDRRPSAYVPAKSSCLPSNPGFENPLSGSSDTHDASSSSGYGTAKGASDEEMGVNNSINNKPVLPDWLAKINK